MAIGHVATGNVVPYTNAGSTTIAAGTVVEFAAMIGVAVGDIPAGGTGQLAVSGVWILPKDETLAITQGDKLYWDASNDEVDKTNSNIPCGRAYTHELALNPTVQVLLNA